ncbi:hypothetical protein EJB05_24802 [Eragrostis curvula]|uniref:Metallo-beta-lactamase domain-containing protein n=1 Tax=Eragrostis curvula TaxID=38414 RepID=A0A5J9VAE8_9POAL|nr:hypothetical protein EJB05_24802 [Eragrostis curvula]
MAKGGKSAAPSTSAPPPPAQKKKKPKPGLDIEGYHVEGVSVAGQETCVIVPALKLAFDIGRCLPFAVSQEFLFLSHAHADHVGCLPLYVAMRSRRNMSPPTVFVPASLADLVRKLFDVHRAMDQSEFPHKLVPLDVGEECEFGNGLRVKAFRTYHVVPSQGYVIYKMKTKLKQEYVGLPGSEIKKLRESGVEMTDTVATPEIAFTGDTMSDFILDPDNADVLKAKILVMESTYVDDKMTIEQAREKGHTHLSEITSLADKLENKAILLIHFSNRYTTEEIDEAIDRLPPSFGSRVYALKKGFDSKT